MKIYQYKINLSAIYRIKYDKKQKILGNAQKGLEKINENMYNLT